MTGPCQSGRTTLAAQARWRSSLSARHATTDVPGLRDSLWIEEQWEAARRLADDNVNKKVLLILDEVRKIPDWSEVVKKLWDEDGRRGRKLHVCILGSVQLLIQRGLPENIAARYETILIPPLIIYQKRSLHPTIDIKVFRDLFW